MIEKKVSINNTGGYKLSAVLRIPKTASTAHAIILCHGLNSRKESQTNIALEQVFLQHNIATFSIDFFSHGESEGNKEDRTLATFVNDILQSIDYLKHAGYQKIGIVGASFGGVAAVIAASKNAGLSVMALKAPGMGQTSRKLTNYEKEFMSKSWITAGTKVHIPTFIVHGSADEDVELELAEALTKSIRSSELEIVDGADHKFTKKEDFERMINHISSFMIEHLLEKK